MEKSLKVTAVNLIQKYRQFILYGIIGGACAGLDFVVYTALCALDVNYLVANIIGIHCGIFCSFILNRHINFKVKDKTLMRFISFYLVGLVGLALSSGILYWMVAIHGWNEIYAKLITIVVVAIMQFFLNKFITFKQSAQNE